MAARAAVVAQVGVRVPQAEAVRVVRAKGLPVVSDAPKRRRSGAPQSVPSTVLSVRSIVLSAHSIVLRRRTVLMTVSALVVTAAVVLVAIVTGDLVVTANAASAARTADSVIAIAAAEASATATVVALADARRQPIAAHRAGALTTVLAAVRRHVRKVVDRLADSEPKGRVSGP